MFDIICFLFFPLITLWWFEFSSSCRCHSRHLSTEIYVRLADCVLFSGPYKKSLSHFLFCVDSMMCWDRRVVIKHGEPRRKHYACLCITETFYHCAISSSDNSKQTSGSPRKFLLDNWTGLTWFLNLDKKLVRDCCKWANDANTNSTLK